MSVAFTINENDLVPEGIAYDATQKRFYVSSTYRRKIVQIDSKDNVSDFTKEQQDGLMSVVGMRVDSKRRILWAARGNVGKFLPMKNMDSLSEGQSGLFKYDLPSGKLLKKYWLGAKGEQHFLNDLTLDKKGKVYVTDTQGKKIYSVGPEDDELEVFYEFAPSYTPNGIDITPDNKYLFVALYSQPKNLFCRIALETKKFEVVELPENWSAGADGMYFYKGSLIAIIPGANDNKIIQYTLDETMLRATSIKVYIENDPLLSQPSTGVIVGNKLYFVATSNLQLFARLYSETNGNVNLSDLPPARIGIVQLD